MRHIPLGVNYGKIPLDKNEQIMMEGSDAEEVKEVKKYQNAIKTKVYRE